MLKLSFNYSILYNDEVFYLFIYFKLFDELWLHLIYTGHDRYYIYFHLDNNRSFKLHMYPHFHSILFSKSECFNSLVVVVCLYRDPVNLGWQRLLSP